MTLNQFIRATGAEAKEGWKGSTILTVAGCQIVWRSGIYGGAIVTHPDNHDTYHSNPTALREIADMLKEGN